MLPPIICADIDISSEDTDAPYFAGDAKHQEFGQKYYRKDIVDYLVNRLVLCERELSEVLSLPGISHSLISAEKLREDFDHVIVRRLEARNLLEGLNNEQEEQQ